MTLGFSTNWPAHMGALAGKPNYFIDKIWISIIDKRKDVDAIDMLIEYLSDHNAKFEKFWDDLRNDGGKFHSGKVHTIRAGHRWKAGMLIHPVINNRTKNRFQFAPTMNCDGVQKIEIQYEDGSPNVYINNQLIYWQTRRNTFGELVMKMLAVNDGFNSLEDFFAYFNKDFRGQIIHWTDLRY